MRSATLWCQAGAWINPSKAKGVRHGQKVRGKAADADGGDTALFEKAMAFRPNMLWLLEQHQVKRARDSTHFANTTLCPCSAWRHCECRGHRARGRDSSLSPAAARRLFRFGSGFDSVVVSANALFCAAGFGNDQAR